MVTKTVRVDVWSRIYESISVVQFEILGRSIAFELLSGSTPINLTGCSVTFYADKPDASQVFNECVITDATSGKCTYTFTEQTVIVAGVLSCTLVIVDADGDELRSQPFEIHVISSPDYTAAVESTSEYTALAAALALVTDHEARIAELEEGT